MKILVIGSGGREHALAWKISQSSRVEQVLVAPGNGGTAGLAPGVVNIPVAADDVPGLVNAAREHRVDLVVVGPELALALGLVDALQAEGIPAFGPTRAAAQIESSKVFAKAFMQRHGIPTARYASFTDYDAARRHLRDVPYPVVIKADGLAAGKGVLIPSTIDEAESALHTVMVERAFGEAGDAVVIEERLSGPEASLLAFCDGSVARPMPVAQDHKRVFDHDQGPNTGGMGAFAPSPLVTPDVIERAMREIVEPAVAGLRAEGMPFVGVLYVGLMITRDGPRVLEFNCRFGDPETQAILLLLKSDVIDVMECCIQGQLDRVDIRWQEGAAATVVLASGGYPGHYERGYAISGLEEAAAMDGVVIFHAGTRLANGVVVTNGGRVLNVSALGADLPQALERAYAAVGRIHFQGMHYRKDIGVRTPSS